MHTDLVIMLVDNDETDNLITSKLIEHSKLCHQIVQFTSGRMALQFLETNAGSPDKLPDLIFLDLNMPVMNGSAFLQELEALGNRLTKNPKVVVLSSADLSQNSSNYIDSKRVIKFLTKPLNPMALSEILEKNTVDSLKVA